MIKKFRLKFLYLRWMWNSSQRFATDMEFLAKFHRKWVFFLGNCFLQRINTQNSIANGFWNLTTHDTGEWNYVGFRLRFDDVNTPRVKGLGYSSNRHWHRRNRLSITTVRIVTHRMVAQNNKTLSIYIREISLAFLILRTPCTLHNDSLAYPLTPSPTAGF